MSKPASPRAPVRRSRCCAWRWTWRSAVAGWGETPSASVDRTGRDGRGAARRLHAEPCSPSRAERPQKDEGVAVGR